jgi:hypothetical protein
MKLSKFLGIVAAATFALMAFAGLASATTLETNGVKKGEPITIDMSLKSGTSLVIGETGGASPNTCTFATLEGKDSTSWTGAVVSGPLSTVTFDSCKHGPVVTHKAGSFSIEWISGTTNGTLRWNGGEFTLPVTVFGSLITATCTTSNTVIGTLTGTGSGTSTADTAAVLNCGSFLPSANLQATWVFTGEHAVGVVS